MLILTSLEDTKMSEPFDKGPRNFSTMDAMLMYMGEVDFGKRANGLGNENCKL